MRLRKWGSQAIEIIDYGSCTEVARKYGSWGRNPLKTLTTEVRRLTPSLTERLGASCREAPQGSKENG